MLTLLMPAILLALGSDELSARIYRIGAAGDPACDSGLSLAQAIAVAKADGQPDTIHVVIGHGEGVGRLVIEGQDLTIRGGFETCADADAGEQRTRMTSGLASRVFDIRGPSRVRLEHLTITGGQSADNGGAILFRSIGDGQPNSLSLRSTVLENNATLGSGGAIAFLAGSIESSLVLEQDVVVLGNQAQNGGGGLYLEGDVFLLAESAGLAFERNRVTDGNGGAIYLKQPASADIAVSEVGPPTFLGNSANFYGGALFVYALDASGVPAHVRLNGLSFVDNTVIGAGGAIGILGNRTPSTETARVCGRNLTLSGNKADRGSALMVSGGTYGYCADDDFPLGAAGCPPDIVCNRIDNGDSLTGSGATAVWGVGGKIDLRATQFLGNHVDEESLIDLVATQRAASELSVSNVVISGTRFHQQVPVGARTLIKIDGNSTAHLAHATLAHNAPGVAHTAFLKHNGQGGLLTVENSIVEAPLGTTLQGFTNQNLVLRHVILPQVPAGHEDNSTLVATLDPGFDSSSNLQLLPTSPAVDFAPRLPGLARDIAGRPRVDVRDRVNRFGSADLGAFEMQPEGVVFGDGLEE